MKIALDAIGIHYSGGGRTSILNLLHHLFTLDAGNEYLVFLSQPEPSLETRAGNVIQHIVPIKNRFAVRIYAQAIIPYAIQKYDLVHFTKNLGVFGPLPPSVVTIHDLTTILYPQVVPWIDYYYWRSLQGITVRNARLVITVSHIAARDIEELFHVSSEKIRVIHHGCADFFKPSSQDAINQVCQKYNISPPYILHVGRIDLKKNLTVLVKAYERLCKRTGFQGKLVLVGEVYKKSEDTALIPTISELGLQDKVIITGYVPDHDLPHLYSGAMFCVYPSIHEGFGLAPLEAMTCGSPLIAHKAGAVEEVVGDAGIVLETVDVDNLAEQMYRLVVDNALRQTLRERGLIRSQQFSWQKAAEKLLEVYNEVGPRDKWKN